MNAERFNQLWTRNVSTAGKAGSAAEVFAYLEQQYNDPRRCYHDADHIDQCLDWLDRYADAVSDPDAVELAIWFHDACYLPNPCGHEERSARLFSRMVGDGMSAERRDRIIRMIGFTTHSREPESEEEALLVDIDLASFCRPWHQYLIDTARCRIEKRRIEGVDFCKGQIGFLKGLAERPHFYFSPQFRVHHEQAARHNINRILELLEKRCAVQ